MIALAGLLILVAGALLVGGLGNGETTMLWGSVGVSAAAAVVLVLNTVRRTRAARAVAEDDAEPVLVAATAHVAGPSAPASPTPRPPTTPPAAGAVEEPAEPVHPAVPAPAATPAAAEPSAAAEPAVPVVAVPAAVEVPPAVPGSSTGSHAHRTSAGLDEDGEPVEEDVEVTDLLLVLDLTDEVEVVDEHPRYHLAGCSVTAGQDVFGLPLPEAKQDGFTACGVCRPDRHLADAERRRRAAAKA